MKLTTIMAGLAEIRDSLTDNLHEQRKHIRELEQLIIEIDILLPEANND